MLAPRTFKVVRVTVAVDVLTAASVLDGTRAITPIVVTVVESVRLVVVVREARVVTMPRIVVDGNFVIAAAVPTLLAKNLDEALTTLAALPATPINVLDVNRIAVETVVIVADST